MAEYRTTEQIRAEADCEYHVFWLDNVTENNQEPQYHMDKIIANDHDDAIKQVMDRADCYDVMLVLKGEFLVLWQG